MPSAKAVRLGNVSACGAPLRRCCGVHALGRGLWRLVLVPVTLGGLRFSRRGFYQASKRPLWARCTVDETVLARVTPERQCRCKGE